LQKDLKGDNKMTRIVLTLSTAALFILIGGCNNYEKYADLCTPGTPVAQPGAAPTTERDVLEQLAVNRAAYIESLQNLVNYYTKNGNEMKLKWARKELANVLASPQYSYVVEAQVAGPDLRAINSIPQADALYENAVATDNKAREVPLLTDDKMLRLAVQKYNQLIREYPTSDKIGQAAYKMGLAYEHFNEWAIAALYFERAAQWDKNIKYPARFKAAFLYDRYLHDRQKAIMYYQDALTNDTMSPQYRAYAQNRVLELGKKEIQE
jgi:tetratricopeptide (TPR) repeat protein